MPKQVNHALRFLNSINSSKLLAGLAMIILNLFSKYVVVDLSKSQEAFIRNTITREILIFIIVFVGTKDISENVFFNQIRASINYSIIFAYIMKEI